MVTVVSTPVVAHINRDSIWNWKVKLSSFKPNTVYVFVFSVGQEKQLEAFKQCQEIEIIFESPLAVNKTPGHGDLPRNRVVIARKKNIEQVPEVPPVPKMPVKRTRLSGGQSSGLL